MDMKIKRGQILRQLRLLRQLTQNEAAENFGISQQTYQKYESGKTEPPYDLLCDFAAFYGVSTDYLLGRTPVKQMATEQPDPLADIDVSALEKRIIKKYT
ncbi:MAG: helix-turn-helix domain-containing protein, partial [Ruminococcus sp.]|nr:helix-turn-helix domain-containing protein [Ruminococcus sp.]